MNSRKLLLIPAAILALLVIAACAPVAQTDGGSGSAPVSCAEVEITEDDGQYDLNGCVLRIAVENAYQPFNYIDTETGEAVPIFSGLYVTCSLTYVFCSHL